MIITAMRNWRPEPGDLLEWRPTEQARAVADAAPVEADPPTFLQQTHVRGFLAKQQRGGPHRAFLGVTTEVEGDLDEDALTRALTSYVHRHDGLHTFFSAAGPAIVRHRIDSTAIDFEVHNAGALEHTDAFADYIHHRFENDATSIRWPGFAFGAVRRPGSFTIYYGCDHAFSDGASQVLALSELVDRYRAEVDGSEPSVYTSAPTGGFPDYACTEHALAQAHTAESPELAEWLQIFESHGSTMPAFALDLGLAPSETAPVRPVEFDLLDTAGTDAFDAVCKAAGGKLISGIYAALAITDYELAGRPEYYGMSVLNSRDVGNYALSQGWFCNFAPVAFRTADASSFRELMPLAHEGHLRSKRLARVPVQAVIMALLASGASAEEVAKSPHMLSYIDFRWFPGVGSTPYEKGLLFTGEGETANASMWINRDHSHLYFGSQTPDTPQARNELSRYHEHLHRVIAAVARDGDYAIPRSTVVDEGLILARHNN